MELRKYLYLLISLFIFGIALYFPFLGLKEFQGEEGRRVLLALEMLERGKFLIPSLFDEPYYLKPPFFNWSLALYFKLVGSWDEFTARSFSSLTLIFTSLFLTFLWFSLLKNYSTELKHYLYYLLPGLIFLTTPEVIDKALRAEIDALYTSIITIACFSWFYLYEIKGKKFLAFFLSGLFLGLGILTKTFQALVFFYLAFIPYLLWQKRGREIFSLAHLLGIASFTSIFLLWAIPLSLEIGLKQVLISWYLEYLSAAKAQEMSFLQHLEAYTLSALIGFSPWVFTLLGLLNTSFRGFLIEKDYFYKLYFYSLFLFGFSYFFHFIFPGARLRYMLPSIGGLSFLASLFFLFYFQRENSFSIRIYSKIFRFIPILFSFLGIIFLIYSLFKLKNFYYPFYFVLFFFLFFNLFFMFKKQYNATLLFIYFISVVFFVKQLYVSFYYPYHQKNLNYNRKAAKQILEMVGYDKPLYLCKIIPHHLLYYLKYQYQKKNIIYLSTCKDLPREAYVLILKGDYSSEITEPKRDFKVFEFTIRSKEYYLIYFF